MKTTTTFAPMLSAELMPKSRLDLVFYLCAALYLFVLPISGTIALRYLIFIILLGLSATLLIRQRQWPELPFAPVWLAYFLVALTSCFYAVDSALVWSELKVEVIYWIVVVAIGVAWGRRLPSFAGVIGFLAVMNAMLTLAAFHYVSLDMDYPSIQSIPAFAYAGLDANWLLIVMFFSAWLIQHQWREGRRGVALVLVALLVLDLWAMLAIQNRQNLLALGVGTGVAALLLLRRAFNWRRAALFLGLLGLVAILLVIQLQRRQLPPPTAVTAVTAAPAPAPNLADVNAVINTAVSGDVRWRLWAFSLAKIAEHPWYGGGVGRPTFAKMYPEYRPSPEIWHAHNMIINKGIQMGIPGMLSFLALWVALALELARHARHHDDRGSLAIAGLAVVAAIFAKNMTDDFFVRNVALYFWLVLALLLGYLRQSHPASP